MIARNPSPFTFHGTGTYVVGHGRVAVIDPGPALGDHIEALAGGLRGETITHVLVTHTHRDHSPGCALLRRFSAAPTYGFGPHGSGRPKAGEEVEVVEVVEEGADFEFKPDIEVRDGDVIECDGFSFECVHTPGHTSNHVCYRLREERALFCGDHVMGWSTTIVSPPDGHMGTLHRESGAVARRRRSDVLAHPRGADPRSGSRSSNRSSSIAVCARARLKRACVTGSTRSPEW